MHKLLQLILCAFGATVVAIGLLHIVMGPACIPGSVPVNATMDSEDRFYGSMFMSYGAALLWAARDPRARVGLIKFLAAAFFVSGLARIVSMLAVGLPHPLFVFLTAVELLLPLLLAWLASRVAEPAR